MINVFERGLKITSQMNRKAQIGTLQNMVVTLVVIGIVLGVGFMILEDFYGEMDDNSQAKDSVNKTIVAVTEIPEWLDTIVIVLIAGLLLFIVFSVMPKSSGAV